MNNLGELNFTINGDASGGEEALNATAKNIDVLKLSLTGLQKAMFIVTAINQVIRLFETLGKAINWVSEKYKEMSGQETNAARMERLAGGVDKLTKSYDELKRSIAETSEAQKNAAALADDAAAAQTRAALAGIKLQEQRDLLATSDPTKRAAISARAKAAASDVIGQTESASIDRRIAGNTDAQTQVLINRNRLLAERNAAAEGVRRSRADETEERKAHERHRKAALYTAGIGGEWMVETQDEAPKRADAAKKRAEAYQKQVAEREKALAALDAEEATLKREAEILQVQRRAARDESKAATLAGRQNIAQVFSDTGVVSDTAGKAAPSGNEGKAATTGTVRINSPVPWTSPSDMPKPNDAHSSRNAQRNELAPVPAKQIIEIKLPPLRGAELINSRGPIMGGQAPESSARDLRAAAAEALQREQVTLLSRISGQLEE